MISPPTGNFRYYCWRANKKNLMHKNEPHDTGIRTQYNNSKSYGKATYCD
ncbi:hypothetical protein B7P43_G05665 [Cryptotermes secundus]|uniref:Uncharacterized protein n=1 Tax=Cryptotermes secundus TaxID=105785 RepID=A0A2J7RFT4_9NEOP|nr:hypothetical protein B7P43_G05665 [Cryptotermes secundus]